jgi:hypothetical protein
MINRVVIDTNVLISWYKSGVISNSNDLASVAPIFSIITKIEALGFQEITKDEVKAISTMLDNGELIYIDSNIAQQTINLRQKHKIKTPDAVIAATALVNDVELWTANISDFSKIEGLRLHNPIT